MIPIRSILSKSDQLPHPGGSGCYQNLEVIGSGASCVVYRAEFLDRSGLLTEHLLKEYNPAHLLEATSDDWVVPVLFEVYQKSFELQNDFSVAILGLSKFFREDAAVTAQTMQIGNRPCRIYGEPPAEYLLLQMTGEHELQSMDSEVAASAQSAHHFLFAAIPVESWNDALSPREAPAVWGKQSFGGKAAETLPFLTEQVIPTLMQQFCLPKNVKIILGGYSLAGLFALWASTQTDLFYGVAAASPSVWFPGWMEFEQQHPIQAQHIYLSLGDKEEHTKNTIMAAVGDNIRTLHSRLTERGADYTLEWNSGGHFKNADLRTAKAFQWAMEESR